MLDLDGCFVVEVAASVWHTRPWTFGSVRFSQEAVKPGLPLVAVFESELRAYSVRMYRSSALPRKPRILSGA
jgi:hypothetical protein